MSRLVKTLVQGLSLPDGNWYPANATVTLTDDQFADLDPNIFTSGKLQDLGGYAVPLLLPPSTLPTPYRDPSWLETFQAGHTWTATGSGIASSNMNSTSQVCKGTQSARMTTTGTAAAAQFRRTGMPTIDLTNKMIRLTFRVDDVAHLEHMSFYVGDTTLANNFRWTVHTHSKTTSQNWVQSGEWVVVTLSWADVNAAAGTYTLDATKKPSTTTGFTDMQFTVFDDAAGPVTCHLQSVEVIPSTSVTFPKGVVSITFDDSWQSVYDLAKPKMDALGYRGTQYTIADYVGSASDRLTLGELKTLSQFCGWEIGGHSFANATHAARYPNLTSAQVDDDLRNLRGWLVTNGFSSDSFAYPGGQFSKTTDGVSVESLVSRYFGSARSIISDNFESYGAPMPFRMRAYTGITDGSGIGGITVASMTAAGGPLDRAANGGWLVLCLHQIITGTPTDTTQISQAGFNQLMDGIAARGIPVRPVSDVLRNNS